MATKAISAVPPMWCCCRPDDYRDLTTVYSPEQLQRGELDLAERSQPFNCAVWLGKVLNDALWDSLVWGLGVRRLLVTQGIEKALGLNWAEVIIEVNDHSQIKNVFFTAPISKLERIHAARVAYQDDRQQHLRRIPKPVFESRLSLARHEKQVTSFVKARWEGMAFAVPHPALLQGEHFNVFEAPMRRKIKIVSTDSFIGGKEIASLLVVLYYGLRWTRVRICEQPGHKIVKYATDGWADTVIHRDGSRIVGVVQRGRARVQNTSRTSYGIGFS